MPITRRLASRHTAKASGKMLSMPAPSVKRWRNAGVLACRSASLRACNSVSKALICSTNLPMRFSSRLFLLPKILRKRLPIMELSLSGKQNRGAGPKRLRLLITLNNDKRLNQKIIAGCDGYKRQDRPYGRFYTPQNGRADRSNDQYCPSERRHPLCGQCHRYLLSAHRSERSGFCNRYHG